MLLPLTLGLLLLALLCALHSSSLGETHCFQLCIGPLQVPRVKARHSMVDKVQLFSSIVGGPEWYQQTQLASPDESPQDKAAPDL